MEELLKEIRFDKDGLVLAVAQQHDTGEVLMMAWMNAEALQATIEKGEAVYWSRSRQKLWHKGETSGHVQQVDEIRLDCDGDTLLLQVEQKGGIACHTGRAHCFFQRLNGAGEWETTEAVVKDPTAIYGE